MERKATEILINIESQNEKILGYLKNIDNNNKLIYNLIKNMNMRGLVQDQIVQHFIKTGHKTYQCNISPNTKSNAQGSGYG